MLCCRIMRLFQDRREGTWGCEAVQRDQLLHCADGSKSITEQRQLKKGEAKMDISYRDKGAGSYIIIHLSLYAPCVGSDGGTISQLFLPKPPPRA